ncbi:MAG TPA: SusE domain-containing protein [Chitinophagaceae bacterium]
MKNIFKVLLLTLVSAVSILSCTKKENKIYYEGGTAPVLSASIPPGTIPLSFANKDNLGLKLMWTNPNYKFTTGVSSQDVSYQIEIDTTGANFTNPKKVTIGIGKDLSKAFTQSDFNSILFSQLKLLDGMSHNIEIRIKSFLVNNNATLTSNVLKFTATPYTIPPKVTLPTTGKLYLVGNATPGGWNNPVPVPSQEFTKVSNTLYELTVTLVGGGSILFLPLNGDWGVKFGGTGSGNNSNNPNGDTFRIGGSDLAAPAAAGNYKISVDFQAGTFSVTKL